MWVKSIVVTDVLDEFLKRAELNEFLNEINEFLANFWWSLKILIILALIRVWTPVMQELAIILFSHIDWDRKQ